MSQGRYQFCQFDNFFLHIKVPFMDIKYNVSIFNKKNFIKSTTIE